MFFHTAHPFFVTKSIGNLTFTNKLHLRTHTNRRSSAVIVRQNNFMLASSQKYHGKAEKIFEKLSFFSTPRKSRQASTKHVNSRSIVVGNETHFSQCIKQEADLRPINMAPEEAQVHEQEFSIGMVHLFSSRAKLPAHAQGNPVNMQSLYCFWIGINFLGGFILFQNG